VPYMPGWRWIATPGHAAGHISLFREADRALIAGDAFVTTNQETAYGAITQEPEMHGPPMYLTTDWEAAGNSVRALAALEPNLVISGHGRAMHGSAMQKRLQELASNFERIAVPGRSRYLQKPARPEDGSAYRRP
jgi:glyoxylase-like metal-dependent hydrolase (beta-lactamase superfamily II)